MEKHKLIQKIVGICIFSPLIGLVFCFCQSLTYSFEESTEREGVQYVKHKAHVMELRSKEPFEIRNGRRIYDEYCSPCHGETGKGNGRYFTSDLKPTPRDFTNPEFMKKVKDDYLFEVIWKGTAAFGKSSYCPPWGNTLKEDEKVSNIISFLRTLASAGK